MNRAQIRAILKRVEWEGRSFTNWKQEPACSCCGAPRSEGHEPRCMLREALVDLACDECETEWLETTAQRLERTPR
jgi:hypothetical protein